MHFHSFASFDMVEGILFCWAVAWYSNFSVIRAKFTCILYETGHEVSQQDTPMRKAFTPNRRLGLTWYYLAPGRMCYSTVACCISLWFPFGFWPFYNANWIVSSDHMSINVCVPSLLHRHNWPRFFNAIFLTAKSTRLWRCKGLFVTPELSLLRSVMSTNTLGSRILWFLHTVLYLGGSRLPLEVV